MFGSKNYITSEECDELLKPLTERINDLEECLTEQTKTIQSLASQVADLQRALGGENCMVGTEEEVKVQDESLPDNQFTFIIDNDANEPTMTSHTYYLSAPTPDGVFQEISVTEEMGKSMYKMTTDDGVNGVYEMISSPDALATALISVSQFVKPACRIEGSVHGYHQAVRTIEKGTIVKQNGQWKVQNKAKISFE